VALTPSELDALEEACGKVPLTSSVYLTDDPVMALVETVVDYQMQTVAVERALRHFVEERSHQLRTVDDLRACLDGFPDTPEGNVDLAQHLWGYRLWTRAQQLRGLVAYFQRQGVATIDELKTWARESEFKDFEGKVKGLGPAVYRWLIMRLGVQTVKPDVHVLRFVSRAIGRPVREGEAVAGLEAIASRLGVKAAILDWSIWEHERS
jgi:3-methyladenine DNA glycosylase/8-oxoguanine DNA glycosylase